MEEINVAKQNGEYKILAQICKEYKIHKVFNPHSEGIQKYLLDTIARVRREMDSDLD